MIGLLWFVGDDDGASIRGGAAAALTGISRPVRKGSRGVVLRDRPEWRITLLGEDDVAG
jgi:hypothetical protein